MRGVEGHFDCPRRFAVGELRSPSAEPLCEAKGRFKSVIVGNSDEALLAMSAYIDLNPVRAGIVDDPADFVFSGYGEACGGSRRARCGLGLALQEERQVSWEVVQSSYRKLLYGVGVESGVGEGGRRPAAGSLMMRRSLCLSPADDSPCGRRFGAGSATSPTGNFRRRAVRRARFSAQSRCASQRKSRLRSPSDAR